MSSELQPKVKGHVICVEPISAQETKPIFLLRMYRDTLQVGREGLRHGVGFGRYGVGSRTVT